MAAIEKINIKDIYIKGLDSFTSVVIITEDNEKFIIEEKDQDQKIAICEAVETLIELQAKHKLSIWEDMFQGTENELDVLCDLDYLSNFDFRSVTNASIVFPFQLEEDEN